MKIENYLVANILDNEWEKYNNEIREFFTLHKADFLYGQIRDNCGVVAASFCSFMQEKGLNFERVGGEFKTNKGVFSKLDFYKEELNEIIKLNLNPNKIEDRLRFVEIYHLHERQKKIPHYWNKDEQGFLIDLSGYCQFVKTGLVEDLNPDRYFSKNNVNKILKP